MLMLVAVLFILSYKANSTYDQPLLYPTDLRYVFLNGKLVIENDTYKGALAGKALKKNQ